MEEITELIMKGGLLLREKIRQLQPVKLSGILHKKYSIKDF